MGNKYSRSRLIDFPRRIITLAHRVRVTERHSASRRSLRHAGSDGRFRDICPPQVKCPFVRTHPCSQGTHTRHDPTVQLAYALQMFADKIQLAAQSGRSCRRESIWNSVHINDASVSPYNELDAVLTQAAHYFLQAKAPWLTLTRLEKWWKHRQRSTSR